MRALSSYDIPRKEKEKRHEWMQQEHNNQVVVTEDNHQTEPDGQHLSDQMQTKYNIMTGYHIKREKKRRCSSDQTGQWANLCLLWQSWPPLSPPGSTTTGWVNHSCVQKLQGILGLLQTVIQMILSLNPDLLSLLFRFFKIKD